MNDRARNDRGVSDALGAVILISVVALGITDCRVAILSSPVSGQDTCPECGSHQYQRYGLPPPYGWGYAGIRGEYRILADYVTGNLTVPVRRYRYPYSGLSGIR